MKPIAMKCSEEQFEKIKPILEKNLMIEKISDFNQFEYLVNNSDNFLGVISNRDNSAKNNHNRTCFEEWDEKIFLKYCGIIKNEEIKPNQKTKPIAMKCSEEQFEKIKPILEKNNLIIECIGSFILDNYLINNYRGNLGVITNMNEFNKYRNNRTCFEEWDEKIFLKYCGIIKNEEIKPTKRKRVVF